MLIIQATRGVVEVSSKPETENKNETSCLKLYRMCLCYLKVTLSPTLHCVCTQLAGAQVENFTARSTVLLVVRSVGQLDIENPPTLGMKVMMLIVANMFAWHNGYLLLPRYEEV